MLDHDTSIVATRPSSKRSSITALSSAVVRCWWTSVSPHANASRMGVSLPNRYRAASVPCEAMSRSAPPPALAASQKWAACGPLCASRARKLTGRPMPPASTISRMRTSSAANTTFSRYPCQTPASVTAATAAAASAPVLPRGLVQATPLPWRAADWTASRCSSLGSDTTTRSTSGSAHTASMESYARAYPLRAWKNHVGPHPGRSTPPAGPRTHGEGPVCGTGR